MKKPKSIKKYYTIYLGNKIWEDVIDDMNSGSDWGVGGKVWASKSKALACIRNLKGYDEETETRKFKVVELVEKPPEV